MVAELVGDLACQLNRELLMQARRRGRHGERLTIDQFPPFVIGPMAIVAIAEMPRFGDGLRHGGRSFALALKEYNSFMWSELAGSLSAVKEVR
jgi:hypothetical protein